MSESGMGDGTKSAPGDQPLFIGSVVDTMMPRSFPHVVCDSPELRPYIDTACFRAHAAERLGIELAPQAVGDAYGGQPIKLEAWQRARHSLVVGQTGSGKSRAAEHIGCQELAFGCSAVVVDPKGETADRLLDRAVAVGIRPENIVVFDGRWLDQGRGVPGFNPFRSGLPLPQIVGDLVSLIKATSSNWGVQISDTLTNTAYVLGTHGLSLAEAPALLTREDYRDALLARPVATHDPSYIEAVNFFRYEYSVKGKGARPELVSPILNKLRETLRSPYLRAVLCARDNTLQFDRLWQEQSLVVARISRGEIGDEAAGLLAGLLVQTLYRTALRLPGTRPVVLVLDELGVVERLLGGIVSEIVAVARSLRIRLLTAFQHAGQLSESLRSSLFANCAVQLYFALGDDARIVAASLARKSERQVVRFSAKIDGRNKETGEPEYLYRSHPILDASGFTIQVRPQAWEAIVASPLFAHAPVVAVQEFAKTRGVPLLFVRAADSREPMSLARYLSGLKPADYQVEGPDLRLVIRFPRPRLSGAESTGETEALRRWTRRLEELPIQHAVLRARGMQPAVIRFANVADTCLPAHRLEAALTEAGRANGQSPRQIAETEAWRTSNVERLAAGMGAGVHRAPFAVQETEDGSIV